VTGEALDFAMASLGIQDAVLRDRLMDLFLHIEAFPDARHVLEALQRAKRPALILSNGSPAMLTAAMRSAEVDHLLEAALSVEAAGIYKPHRTVYELVTLHLKLRPERVCFVSSNGWDAAGAAHFGFAAVWANRAGAPRENLPGILAAEIRDLDALPKLLGL
jgi:2-haloacid dehalogenase